ncbi:MAG: branched-chain amino acid ABC transporter permease [Actinomycetota bacterium]
MGQTLILGLMTGGIYGLFALGIALVYRGSRTFNFAQGEIGTMGLFIAFGLVERVGLPWLVGALVAILAAALVGFVFERLVVRVMIDASRVAVAVGSVGLLMLLLAVEFKIVTVSARSLRAPIGGVGKEILGVVVSPTHMLSIGVAALVAVGLALMLKKTDFGLGVLAAAQDPVAVRLVGVPLARVSGFVWAMGAALSALAALLVEPTVGVFAPGYASELFLKGLAAAVVGGLTSLPGAFVGGLVVGVTEAGVSRVFASAAFPGIKSLTVLGLILCVLLFRPGGLLSGLVAKGESAS